MPVFCAFETAVFDGTSWANELTELTDMKQDDDGVPIISRAIQFEPGKDFSIGVKALPSIPIDSESVSIFLFVDDELQKLLNIDTPKLKQSESYIMLSRVDLNYKSTSLVASNLKFSHDAKGGTIQIKVLRTETQYAQRFLKAKDKDVFVAGQMIKCFKSSEPLGTGNHWVVNDDCQVIQSTKFLDPLENPWVTITYQYRPIEYLQALLLIPRPLHLPDYHILSDPSRFPPCDMDSPVFNQGTFRGNFTQGSMLRDVDALVFEHYTSYFNRKVEQMTLAIAKGWATKSLQISSPMAAPDWTQFSEMEIRELAVKSVFTNEFLDKFACLGLTVFEHLDRKKMIGYVRAAMLAVGFMDTQDFFYVSSRIVLEGKFASKDTYRIMAENMEFDELVAKCEKHYPELASETLTYAELTKWAELRLREEALYIAKVQVMRVLAEKILRKRAAGENENEVEIDAVEEGGDSGVNDDAIDDGGELTENGKRRGDYTMGGLTMQKKRRLLDD